MNKLKQSVFRRWGFLVFLIALPLIVAACSMALSIGGGQRTLSITLMPDGSKQFVYQIVFRRDTRNDARITNSTVSRERTSRRTPGERDYKALQKSTHEVVISAGYCRQGYLELDYRLSINVFWLRGECREAASKADVEHFSGKTQIPLTKN